jgi:predicted dehydrogenase
MKNIAIVGCGNISGIYFENLCNAFSNVTVTACADLDDERAQAKAAVYPGVSVKTLDQVLADPDIDIVVNLSTPQGHFSIARQVIEAGKSVHNEKPLTLTRDEGKELLRLAAEKGVRVGSAPDTFMGAGIQTCLQLIQEGAIGDPIGAHAFMLCHGHESWHPDPEFYYKAGGGPMFDMGPYYLTALVALLGPVRRATGSVRKSFPTRTITSEKKRGQIVEVDVPTHVTGILDFASGAVGTITTSFDVWAANVPRIEIFGSEGSLSVPDPNTFGGPVSIRKAAGEDWEEVPVTRPYAENSRGTGPADMAAALEQGRPHRANGELAYHVLDIMHAIHDASEQDRHILLESTCEQPALMPIHTGGAKPGR